MQEAAIKCKHCGEMLDKQTDKEKEPMAIEPEEKTLKEEKPVLRSCVAPIILGGFFLYFFSALFSFFNLAVKGWFGMIGVLFVLVTLIHRNSVKYTITNKRVMAKRGVLGKKVDEIDIQHIRCVSVKQGILARMFDDGDILIGTAGTAGYEIIFKSISNPLKTVALIKSLQK